MRRTTVRLPDDLLDDAKDCARLSGRTLTQLLEDAVRSELTRTAVTGPLRTAEPRAFVYDRGSGEGLINGVDVRAKTPDSATPQAREHVHAQVAEIQEFLRTLPDRDTRSPDEILDYDAHGLPR